MLKDRDSWETPKELFDKLNSQYKFQIDCCATPKNTKCQVFYQNFLQEKRNFSVCWMNPPFSKAHKMFQHFFKITQKGICIYRCDNMETKVWQEQILPNASWIFVFNKRINYEGQTGKGARFPSALIGFNVTPPKLKNGKLLTT